MRRVLLIAITAVAAIAAAMVLPVVDRTTEGSRSDQDQVRSPSPVSVGPRAAGPLTLKPGSRTLVREFTLRGQTLRVETAETSDGSECLLGSDGRGGGSSQCFANGLFGSSKVAFSVNFDGGPKVFRSLDVLGVAAPGVASVALSRTDGSIVRVDLDRTRAFVIESSASDLEANILPARVELFGPSGKRIESVAIPALG